MTNQASSSELPRWARDLLLGVFVLGVIPLAVYGVYKQIVTAREVAPVIQERLLTPYAEAVARQDYEGARGRFTTEDYRGRVGVEAYRAAQRANRDRYGAPKAIEVHVCNETKEPGRPWFTSCDVRYEADRGEVFLSLEIVEHEGQYLIDRSYEREVGHETRVERVF